MQITSKFLAREEEPKKNPFWCPVSLGACLPVPTSVPRYLQRHPQGWFQATPTCPNQHRSPTQPQAMSLKAPAKALKAPHYPSANCLCATGQLFSAKWLKYLFPSLFPSSTFTTPPPQSTQGCMAYAHLSTSTFPPPTFDSYIFELDPRARLRPLAFALHHLICI